MWGSGGKRRVLPRLLARPRPSPRRRPLRASVPRRVVLSPLPEARPSTPRPSRWARGFGGGVRGVAPQAPPAPTPTRPYARGAGHDCLPPVNGRGPRGADPPVASGGLCGVTGGGSPSRVRLPCPAASRGRPASAGRRSSAALGLPRRSPGASPRLPSLGAVSRSPSPTPTTPPAAVCPALPPSFRLSRASDVCPCPLGAQLPVGAPSLRPRWWCGGKGARERGCG